MRNGKPWYRDGPGSEMITRRADYSFWLLANMRLTAAQPQASACARTSRYRYKHMGVATLRHRSVCHGKLAPSIGTSMWR